MHIVDDLSLSLSLSGVLILGLISRVHIMAHAYVDPHSSVPSLAPAALRQCTEQPSLEGKPRGRMTTVYNSFPPQRSLLPIQACHEDVGCLRVKGFKSMQRGNAGVKACKPGRGEARCHQHMLHEDTTPQLLSVQCRHSTLQGFNVDQLSKQLEIQLKTVEPAKAPPCKTCVPQVGRRHVVCFCA